MYCITLSWTLEYGSIYIYKLNITMCMKTALGTSITLNLWNLITNRKNKTRPPFNEGNKPWCANVSSDTTKYVSLKHEKHIYVCIFSKLCLSPHLGPLKQMKSSFQYILYLQQNDRPVHITASLSSTMLESTFDIILDAGLHY